MLQRSSSSNIRRKEGKGKERREKKKNSKNKEKDERKGGKVSYVGRGEVIVNLFDM